MFLFNFKFTCVVGTLGPWDAFLTDESTAIMNTLLNQPRFMAPTLADDVKEQLRDLIQKFLNQDEYEPFAYHVDLEVFPDYLCMVPTPMHLEMVRVRNENNFYRSLKAVEFDIHLIHQNCLLYNEVGSPITDLASELVSKLLSCPPFSIKDSTAAGQSELEQVDLEQHSLEGSSGTIRLRKRKVNGTTSGESPRRHQRRSGRKGDGFSHEDSPHPPSSPISTEVLPPTRTQEAVTYHFNAQEVGSSDKTHSQRRRPRLKLSLNAEDASNGMEGTQDASTQPAYGLRNRKPNLVLTLVKSTQRTRRSTRNNVSFADVECSASELDSEDGAEEGNLKGEDGSDSEAYAEGESEGDAEGEFKSESADLEVRRSSRLRGRSKRDPEEENLAPHEDLLVDHRETYRRKRRTIENEYQQPSSPIRGRAKRLDPTLKRKLYDIMNTMVALDTRSIFKNPVTEDVAPGYFSVVTHLMDFTTMRYSNVSSEGKLK